MEILGNVFNSKGNNTSHVDNRLNKCRQSFYGLNSLGMLYPGAAPEVQAHLYKSIGLYQPVLTYGMECMSYSKDQFRRMESTQGRLIKQCLCLSKSSHNTAMLKALNIEKVQNIVDRNVLNWYHRIFKIESPARSRPYNAIPTCQIYYVRHYSTWYLNRQDSVHRGISS